MKRFCLLSMVLFAVQTIQGADQRGTNTVPPVLRTAEPGDNVEVMLPGQKPAAVPAPPAQSATEVRPAPPADPDRPVFRRSKREYPPEFDRDSADYLNQQIGIWQQMDAQALLGDPSGERPAYGDDQTVNGTIVAFTDPSGRYKQFELDFDRETGLLRTLFVYPNAMSWQDCRHEFGMNVRSTQANKGRTFYSYLDRRLDVLVDATGKVISLGMY
ncbi:MAG TPA: hypothetical protein VMB03_19020 [Bryobacteraceae bacterium]|nr:hypothetical protein [Bryobacteraceae bacterium]